MKGIIKIKVYSKAHHLRLTEKEHDKLKENSKITGLSYSGYIRKLINQPKMHHRSSFG